MTSALSRGLSALSIILLAALTVACTKADEETAAQTPPPVAHVPLPNEAGSFKFAVLGDFGTGKQRQYELAQRMNKVHSTFAYELVAMVGDNLYGTTVAEDYGARFAVPYKALLDAGVKFYASLGNHDVEGERDYEPFNMEGRSYYTFTPAADVRFFILDSNNLDAQQVQWLEHELSASDQKWKIAVFHHPLYSSGIKHGSDLRLRSVLEPLFVKYKVSVVLSGHDHIYERVKPQQDIVYFVVGSGGQLRKGNIDRTSGLTARGFDTDAAFLVAEVQGDAMTFSAISRVGEVVDSGVVIRRR